MKINKIRKPVKVLIALCGGFCLSSVAASESANFNLNNQPSLSANQPKQPSAPSQSSKSADHAGSNQQPGTDQKNSMANYCKEHTC